MRKISNYTINNDEIEFLKKKKGIKKAKEVEIKLKEIGKQSIKNKIIAEKNKILSKNSSEELNKKLVDGLINH